MNIKEACERIWEGYKLYVSTAFVMRKGVELVGLTNETEVPLPVAETFERRGESGMEHQAKMAWLCMAFVENFPDFFAESMTKDELSYMLLAVSLCHDVGEVATGDIPDDGNALHGTKNEAEREVFRRLMGSCSRNGERMLEIFRQFQDKDTFLGQAVHALDKLETVLNLLFLEQFEHYGVMNKKPFVTESDRHFIHVTHTVCTTDCWAAHTKALIQDYPNEITEPVFGLLEVAVRDVRGEMFEWWSERFSLLDDR